MVMSFVESMALLYRQTAGLPTLRFEGLTYRHPNSDCPERVLELRQTMVHQGFPRSDSG